MEKVIYYINMIIMPFFCVCLIKIYKNIRQFFPKTCRFYPSCSEYSLIAFQKKGFLKGFYLTIRRLLKCHSFSEGGIDFVE